MMPPPGCSRKVAIAARQSAAGETRQIASVRSHDACQVARSPSGLGRLVDARVVDEDVDVAAPGDGLVPERVRRRRVAQVGRKRVGRVAELVGELGEPPVAAHVVDDDRGALGGEGAGRRGADAAGRAGDEGDALAVRAHRLSE